LGSVKGFVDEDQLDWCIMHHIVGGLR